MSDGNDFVYWFDGKHWTIGIAPVPDAPGPPVVGGVWYCGTNTSYMTDAGTEGQVLTSHGADVPTWTTPAAGGAPPWLTPVLTNGWSAYGVPRQMPGYCKFADGMGELKGLVKGGLPSVAIFTLAARYRPSENVIAFGIARAGLARIDVLTTGEVQVKGYISAYADNSFVSLSGIRFPVT
jgi:hypothetical protein